MQLCDRASGTLIPPLAADYLIYNRVWRSGAADDINQMCGRYYRRSDKQRIAEAFHVGNLDELMLETAPSYNIAPTSRQPVIVQDWDSGERALRIMRWGLIPCWAKDAKIAASTINAKAETIATAPAFREAFKSRRCLVPADGFYEWQKIDAKTRQPYAIGLQNGSMFAFAGLWERWKDRQTGQFLETYTIITTDPNELMQPLHPRMPAILAPKDYERWLAPADPYGPPMDLLRPYPAEEMKAWKVDAKVGNVRNDEPGLCVEAL